MIVVAKSNSIHKNLEDYIVDNYEGVVINSKEAFTSANIEKLNPAYIFIPHCIGPFIIPAEIYENYECVVFHLSLVVLD